MMIRSFLPKLYDKLAGHRLPMFLATIFSILICSILFQNAVVSDNIISMLPDGDIRVSRDFELLQRSPFARKVIITLTRTADANPELLVKNADRLAANLKSDLFPVIMAGPGDITERQLMPWLLDSLPNVVTPTDLESFDSQLSGQGIQRQMARNYADLLSLEGWFLKGLITRDPLGLRTVGLEKMRYLNLFREIAIYESHFISKNGQNALIVAETPVPITDTDGARALQKLFNEASADSLDPGFKATMISAHRYTLANAEVIRGDLLRILSFSTVAIAIIFLVFLRNVSGIFVFLVPVSVLGVAAGLTGLVYQAVFAVTIGFGAVLMGITVDFALHVYFALRSGQDQPSVILGEVSRPVLYGGFTTLTAFAILFISDLPAQRQLAVFSITGIITALLLSLLVLPHLVRPAPDRSGLMRKTSEGITRYRWPIVVTWLFILILCSWQINNLQFDGDLRTVNYIPEQLAADENQAAKAWGDFRARAMAWSQGPDLDSALSTNYRLFQTLSERFGPEKLTSLAPLWPPLAVQKANRAEWNAFWKGEKGRSITRKTVEMGREVGFSINAFDPFLGSLDEVPGLVDLKGLREAGLGSVVDAMVISADNEVAVLTLLPDNNGMWELPKTDFGGVVHYVSQSAFHDAVSSAIRYDFSRFILLSLIAVTFLISILFRNLLKVLTALLPVFTGLVVMFGTMGALGLTVNIFNVVASILVIGMGVDYGIFMVCKMTEDYNRATGRAILVSGLTTLFGFGALTFGRHPALHSIGITVLLGIGAAIPTALAVIPSLYSRNLE